MGSHFSGKRGCGGSLYSGVCILAIGAVPLLPPTLASSQPAVPHRRPLPMTAQQRLILCFFSPSCVARWSSHSKRIQHPVSTAADPLLCTLPNPHLVLLRSLPRVEWKKLGAVPFQARDVALSLWSIASACERLELPASSLMCLRMLPVTFSINGLFLSCCVKLRNV